MIWPRCKCSVALTLLTLALAVAVALSTTRHAAGADKTATQISRELADLYKADQADRQSLPSKEEEIRALAARDMERRSRVAEIVHQGLLRSAEDYYHAAMLYQHGEKPEDFLLAHELATVAGFKGHKGGRWLSAAALDRFLHALKRPQRFGTQYRREQDGPWTQEPYDRSLPDAIRQEYGVPPLAEQSKPLEELNRGKSQR